MYSPPASTFSCGSLGVGFFTLRFDIFSGMMFGGYIWGTLADIYGRRAVLLVSLTVNGLGGLASSLSQSFPVFLVLRFVSGLGLAAHFSFTRENCCSVSAFMAVTTKLMSSCLPSQSWRQFTSHLCLLHGVSAKREARIYDQSVGYILDVRQHHCIRFG